MENQIQPNITPNIPQPEAQVTQTPASVPTKYSKIALLVLAVIIITIGLIIVGVQIGKEQTIINQSTFKFLE